KLYSIIYVRNYEKEEIVFRQGDPGVGLYIVKEGTADVFSEYANLTCRKIASLFKGDFFGETSLLNESPRSATVVSSDKTVLWGLFKPDLMNLIDSEPKLGVRLILRLSQVVSERLRLANNALSRFDHVD
ncbi:cyclic nucleotide-binding domain-containing protein, partial [bacterium]|nr:cyclic nucleotide-binding domain-containing protein [bacterium]